MEDFKIGKHSYSCSEVTIEEEMNSLNNFGRWATLNGIGTFHSNDAKQDAQSLALMCYMIKKIDDKNVESPESVFSFLMKLPRKDRLSLWQVNGKLNEGTDFLLLMETLYASEKGKDSSVEGSGTLA